MNDGTVVLVAIIVLPLEIMWEAFVAVKLWAWFVVPMFGLPPVSVAYMVGLSALIGLLTKQLSDADPDTFKRFLFPFVWPSLVLLIGWVATAFI